GRRRVWRRAASLGDDSVHAVCSQYQRRDCFRIVNLRRIETRNRKRKGSGVGDLRLGSAFRPAFSIWPLKGISDFGPRLRIEFEKGEPPTIRNSNFAIRNSSMGMSAHPEQVGKKQDDNESASRFELFEEPGQKVPENKDFESVC